MMPFTEKGEEIMGSMKKEYGSKRGEKVFYASKNKGTIKGVEKRKKRHLDSSDVVVRNKR